MRVLGKVLVGLAMTLAFSPTLPGGPLVQWSPTFEGAKERATQSGQLVMVYFSAPWCPVCLETERHVLTDGDVAASIHDAYVAVKVHHDHSPQLVRHYGIRSLPAIVVLRPDGATLDRVEGRVTPQDLAAWLRRLATQARQSAHSPEVNDYTRPANGIQQASLPPQNPPLGLDGYCAVSLSDDLLAGHRRWVLGQRAHGVIHRGRTYLFADAEKAARFFQDPDRYAPALSGRDVVLAVDEGRHADGLREHGAFFGSRVYLFSSEQTLQQFENHPNRYADAAMRLTLRPSVFR